MQPMKSIVSVLLIFILSFPVSSFSFQQKKEIIQTDRKIKINGRLDEWDNFEELPVNLTFAGKKISKNVKICI